ncbi:16463_t:CDS:2 [Funneliformis mosseae]|uniref:16463_t:CDS:1 n=1 Tax=Funneliformis mosseae TaxID=27381 RepID=A0A9N9CUM2_FUNMO|nr:16463_t:CDS:2 [Funneliformis mosseae]
MPYVFSAIGYVTEANTISASSSNFTFITNGIIAYKRPQEVFVSLQCNVLSAPVVEDNNIMFKLQALEFNGKNRTEIPITCVYSTQNSRIMNKLQKGNKINIIGNLIKNDEEVIVLDNYIVYVNNAINFSSMEKKDLSKILWLNLSSLKKITHKNQLQISNDLSDLLMIVKKKKLMK